MPTLYQIIIVALIAAFIILYANKSEIRIKLRDFCDEHKLSLIAKMFDCDFCLSFWTSLAISIVIALITKDTEYLLVVPLSTPIIRFLI